MKYCYLLFILFIISSCKETEENVVFPEDYGSGVYIATSNGVSFYDGEVVIDQIYSTVNSTAISNVKKIKFKGTKAYILADNLYTAKVQTFEDKGVVSGFIYPVDFDFVSPENRAFIVDKGDSKVKVVDLDRLEIVSDIETGDSTRPVSIFSNSYKSFVANGGGLPNAIKDSTIIVVQYRDNLVPLADFSGSLLVGDNPNSGVITSSGDLKVLCKGIYDLSDPSNNTSSSVSDINQYTNEVYSTDNLSGIYNASNLISNWNNTSCYFTAEGGVYSLSPNSLNTTLIIAINSNVINTNNESYADTDSTVAYSEMIYMNDQDFSNRVYKYNVNLSSFVDTIIVDGDVSDINFY